MIDLHNDLITYKNLTANEKREEIKKDLGDGAFVCYALFLHGKNKEYLNTFSWAKEYKYLSIEDVGGLEDFSDILSFSPRYITLTWNEENRYGGGAFSDADLKDEGRAMIKSANIENIAIDLSHLNRKTFYSAIDIAERVLVSHTCCDKLRRHKRNLTDDQIRKVIEKNGVVGLTFVSDFISANSKASVDDIVAHIDYFCSKFSFRNLAIGTDFFGTDNGVDGINGYLDFYKIINKLERIGYSSGVIEDIMTKNAERFLSD